MNPSAKQIIEQVFQKGKSYQSPLLKAKFLDSTEPLQAIIVTKKQLPHAVDRNRVKRRISSALKKNVLPPGALVIMAHKDILDTPFSQLIEEIKILIKKLIK